MKYSKGYKNLNKKKMRKRAQRINHISLVRLHARRIWSARLWSAIDLDIDCHIHLIQLTTIKFTRSRAKHGTTFWCWKIGWNWFCSIESNKRTLLPFQLKNFQVSFSVKCVLKIFVEVKIIPLHCSSRQTNQIYSLIYQWECFLFVA